MNGICLKFYVLESQRHEGRLVHEWLMDAAIGLGLPGCSVFRSIGGYGHHHKRHDRAFVELQGTLPVEVVFVLDEDGARRLLERVDQERLALFHVRVPVECGFTAA